MVIATIELKSSLEKFLKYGTQKGGDLQCSARPHPHLPQ